MPSQKIPGNPGTLARIARYAIRHRLAVTLSWLGLLIAVFAVSTAVGTSYSKDFSLPGTESQRASELLEESFPRQSGDQDQIVFATEGSAVASAANRARIEGVVSKVREIPHVTGVISPFNSKAGNAISEDGRVAFATVSFDKSAQSVSHSSVEKVIATAESVRSPEFQVALGGQAIGQVQQPSLGPTTLIGIGAAVIVLLITFGSLVAMGLPILTALLGLGTGVSLIGIATHVLGMPDFSTELALMIGLGVGIDYSLFIVTRYRENYHESGDIDQSITDAMDTAGRAVLFAGLTVIVALLGMFLLGISILRGLGVAASITVLMTMLAALTMLPVLLSRFGKRLGRGGRTVRARGNAERAPFWGRWSALVQGHPWPAALVGLAIMLVLALPALELRLGSSDAGNDAKGQTTRRAYDLLGQGFGKGFNGPLQVVASSEGRLDRTSLGRIQSQLRAASDVNSVDAPQLSPDGRTAVFQVFPDSAPQDAATTTLVEDLRSETLPPLARGTGATLLVGGSTAGSVDFSSVLSEKLPLFIGVVVLLSALLLLVVFRSLVIPLQGAVMNLLSIAASLGVVVAIFQKGWLGGVLGVTPGPIDAFIPVLLFAIVFGLSMDYEVFLISRVHEAWVRRGDASRAVTVGVSSTGRVITAAALIMVLVFAAFALGEQRVLKLFGIGLASAVFLDAFVVRMLLLPAVLELLGRRTWQLPGRLNRVLPHLAIEPEPAPASTGVE
jgi:RND superfamily putative drug exporter